MRTPSRFLSAVLVVAALVAVPTVFAHMAPQAPQALRVLEPMAGTMAVPNPMTGAAQVGSPVQVRFDLIAQAAASGGAIEIPLTNGVVATARITYATVDGDHVFIAGPLTDGQVGEASFTTVGDILVGRVVVGNRQFMVRHAPNSVFHVVSEIDPASFPRDSEPIVPDRLTPAVPAGLALPAADVTTAHDTGQFVDILVLYTSTAMNSEGGKAAIEADNQGAIDNGNLALANSGLAYRFRLVHQELTSYTETDVTFSNDLTNLQTGAVPNVFALRDQYAADTVTLIQHLFNGPNANCGIGYVMPSNGVSAVFAPFAFNVVADACANSNLTLAHETGHNMGLAHDRYVACANHVSCNPGQAFPYAFGYFAAPTSGGFGRDVMAYADGCAACPRRAIYSTPLANFPGTSTAAGVADSPGSTTSADNTRALAQTMPIVADFRLSNAGAVSITASPTDLTVAAGQAATFIVATSGTALTYQWQISTDGGSSFANLTNGAPYSGVTTATLTVSSTTVPLDGAMYRCVVSSGGVPATSGAATLTVNGTPVFTTGPGSQTVILGQTVTFSVATSGHPLSTFQWQVSTNGGTSFSNLSNGAPYSGVTIATLTVTNVPVSLNGARYRAIATNGPGSSGSATSSAAVLTINGALMVLDAPATGAVVSQPVTIRGWALDRAALTGTGVDTVRVTAILNPGSGQTSIDLGFATYGVARTDVGNVYGHQFDNCGYTLTALTLQAGHYQIVVSAHSTVTGNTLSTSAIVDVNAGVNVVSLWGGARHCIILKSDGTVWDWGYNWFGKLGDGTTDTNLPGGGTDVINDRHTPIQVHGFNNVGFLTSIIAIMGGESHNFAIKSDGTVWSWGWNGSGQLGDGTNSVFSPTPVQVVGLTSVASLGGRGYHSLAIKSDGTVWTWGLNTFGQLGNGTTVNSNVPVLVTGLSQVLAVTGGYEASFALMSDHTLRAWGGNGEGELGDGANVARTSPVTVKGLTNVVQMSSGWKHAVAVDSNGTVWTWGGNANGELGNNTTTDSNVPVQVSGLPKVVAVSGGDCHTAALDVNGQVWTWGCNSPANPGTPNLNFEDQLGDGTTIERHTPVKVVNLTNVVAIAARDYHNIALRSDGSVWTWGFNFNGQLGNNTTTDSNVPVQVIGLDATSAPPVVNGPSSPAMFIDTPAMNASVSQPFTISGWAIDKGAGTGTGVDSVNVTAILNPGTGQTSFNLGPATYGGARSDIGTAYGNQFTNSAFSLSASGLAAGHYQIVVTMHSMVTGANAGTVSTTVDVAAGPTAPAITTAPASQTIASGGTATFSVAASGNPTPTYQWQVSINGGTTFSNLSNSAPYSGVTTTTLTITSALSSLSGAQFRAVATNSQGSATSSAATLIVNTTTSSATGVIDIWGGGSESIALKSDGSVWTWGWDDYGMLGNGFGLSMTDPSTQFDSLIPLQVLGPGGVGHLGSITAIAGGERHNAALDANGEVWTWGMNFFGQLGNGAPCTSMDAPDCMGTTPAKIPGFTSVKAIASRGYHTLALKNDGTVWAWGYNDSGRLGDGTTIDRHSPVPIAGLTGHGGVASLSSGGDVSVALMADHTLMAWGTNVNGAVGNGTTSATGQLTPVAVSQSTGLTSVQAVATGWDHVVALAADGTVWTWGDNSQGELGDSTTISRNGPTKVSGLSNVVGVSAGDGSTAVLLADGTVWTWGALRTGGTVGTGGANFTSFSYGATPVQVAGIDHVVLIRARDYHVLALKTDGTVWAWGWNLRGQIGDGTRGGDKTTPVQVQFGAQGAPAITTQPTNATIASGANASFTVGATGSPTPTFQWQISTNGGTSFSNLSNGAPYSGVTSATLTVTSASASLSGARYRAVATNSQDSATSAAATLTVGAVSTPLMFLDTPTTGASVTQPFTISGWAIDQGAANGTGIDSVNVTAILNPGAGQTSINLGSATYGLARVDVGNDHGHQFDNCGFTLSASGLAAGHYQIVVTMHSLVSGASAGTASATIDVAAGPAVPTITTAPANATVSTGGTATFTVGATGSPTPTFQWQISTNGGTSFSNLSNGAPYSGVTSATLTVTSASASLSGARYRAVATNSQGPATSGAATLTVNAVSTPTLFLDTPSTGATVSQPFTISGWAIDLGAGTGPGVDAVQVTALPNPGSGQAAIALGAATYGGPRVDVGNDHGHQFDNCGFTLSASGLAAGHYQIVVTMHSLVSGASAGTASATIDVAAGLAAPTITTPPANAPISTGGTATFTVTATGSPTPTVQWQISTNSGTSFSNLANGAPYSGVTTATLTATSPSASLSGAQYRAVATNSQGSATSTAATLTVNAVNAVSALVMFLDTPSTGATVGQPFPIAGWAFDRGATTGTGVAAVTVAAFPNPGSGQAVIALGTATYGGPRIDVGNDHGHQFDNCGFTLNASGLAAGHYQIVVTAQSALSGTTTLTASAVVDVSAGPVGVPLMVIDAPTPGSISAQPLLLSGWALDRGSPSGTGIDAVQVSALPSGGAPITLGAATFVTRTDVGAAYGAQFTNAGFTFNVTGLATGAYTLVVSAHSTVTGTNNVRTVAITIPTSASRPQMFLDAPAPNATVSASFIVSGWALDQAAASGSGVDGVDIFAAPLTGGTPGTATLVGHSAGNGARPDLVPRFGSQFTNAGFVVSVAGLAAGPYRITAQAHSTVTGAALFALSADITVSAGPVSLPAMNVDGPLAGATATQPFTVRGWAIDLGAPSGTGVDLVQVAVFAVVGGTPAATATTTVTTTYGGPRPDIGTAFGLHQFDPCNFTTSVSGLTPGTYDLVVSAHSTVAGIVNQTRTVRIIVP